MIASHTSKTLLALIFLVLTSLTALGQGEPVGIQVTMNPDNPWLLRVTLRSFARDRITFYKHLLPWGNRYSMILVAVTSSGRSIDRVFPEDEPSSKEVSLGPGESLTGDVDLHDVFRGMDTALKKGDVHLFWAYQAPDGLGIPRWSGG